MHAMKTAVKVILILIGGAMLLGGGLCAATSVVFISFNGFEILPVTVIASLVALIGFGIARWAIKYGAAPAKNDPAPPKDDSGSI